MEALQSDLKPTFKSYYFKMSFKGESVFTSVFISYLLGNPLKIKNIKGFELIKSFTSVLFRLA